MGDRVMLYNPSVKIGQSPKLHCPWENDPYTVLHRLSDIDYKIQRGRSKSKIVHFNKLKLYVEPQDIAEWPARDLQDEETRPVLSRGDKRERDEDKVLLWSSRWQLLADYGTTLHLIVTEKSRMKETARYYM